ncbi:MAG: hypothetical protein GYB65_03835, partial [Chloroflexi bacterium]|nr:hypothetical protein [Chloroflexota bacterium]
LKDMVARVAEDRQRPSPVGRVVRSVAGAMRSLTASEQPVTRSVQDDVRMIPQADEPLGKLLTEINSIEPALLYRNQRGDDWRWWRGEVRGKIRELLGLTEEYQPAEQVKVDLGASCLLDGVHQYRMVLTAADGLQIPGFLNVPGDMEPPLPALLVYPGEGTIEQTGGVDNGPQNANALALAQAGYITITLEQRGFGALGAVDHIGLDNVARLMGKTWLGITLEDGLLALDYLQTRDDVDSACLGATGLGLGGGLALYTAALDERVRAVVVQNYLGGGMDALRVTEGAVDVVPGLLQYADISDVARLIAPRPALYAYPHHHSSTQQIARAFFDRMRPSYEAFSCPDRTRFVEHKEGSGYDNKLAKDWFQRWLVEEEDTSVLLWAPREYQP